ncbi:MAG: hypothetical protein G3M70_07365 [Candidatus Nitronauta litoralis]|uniref:Uncharacterized protein n=1 Tax=Candidatus Nitronauta litoralis TaxID=2705533 RepID=A0A7T0FZU6_9BACT|nr:MAG: hypothetical protein G3M70_07365 [Candidatus Nitronauta litoralis]
MTKNLGDEIYSIISDTRKKILSVGIQVQLSYTSFQFMKNELEKTGQERFDLQYPIGQELNGEPTLTKSNFSKEEILFQYDMLSNTQLAIGGIYSFVAFMETMFSDLITAIVLKYPEKLPGNKKIDLSDVLKCENIKSLHIVAVQKLMHELTYKSPKDFAESIKNIIDISLLKVIEYQKYIEIKATRDILIHNQGIANEIYCSKAESLSRAKAGEILHIDNYYFLSCYETCLQLTEYLRDHFHKKWHSLVLENEIMERKKKLSDPTYPPS